MLVFKPNAVKRSMKLKDAHVWDKLHPHVFLQLFQSMAPFTEGMQLLQKLIVTQGIPAVFFNPWFLAQYVLIPVNTIVDAIIDITTEDAKWYATNGGCLLYTSPSPRDGLLSRMPSSA